MSDVKIDPAVVALHTDCKAMRLAMGKVALIAARTIESWGDNAAEILIISDAMHALNKVWADTKGGYDAKLKSEREAGRVVISDDLKSGIRPIRAFPKDDAGTPGRKAVVKTAEEIRAAKAGLTVAELLELESA